MYTTWFVNKFRLDLRSIHEVPLNDVAPTVFGEKSSVGVARLLRAAILSGELPPGSTLGEVALGSRLGISRTPIREALVVLQTEGLVDMAPNRTAMVRSFNAHDLHEMHSLRAVLEGHAASLAAVRLTDVELSELKASCRRFRELRRETEHLPRLVDENFVFHDIIIRAAGSTRLDAMIRNVSAVPLIYRSYMTYSEANRTTAWNHHVEIFDALLARDSDAAAQAMTHHIAWARDVALRHLPLVEHVNDDR